MSSVKKSGSGSNRLKYNTVFTYLTGSKGYITLRDYPHNLFGEDLPDRRLYSIRRFTHPSFEQYENDMHGCKIELVVKYDHNNKSDLVFYLGFSKKIESHEVWFFFDGDFSCTMRTGSSVSSIEETFLSLFSHGDEDNILRFQKLLEKMNSLDNIPSRSDIEKLSVDVLEYRLSSQFTPRVGKSLVTSQDGTPYRNFDPVKILTTSDYIDFEPHTFLDYICISYVNLLGVDTYKKFDYYFQETKNSKNVGSPKKVRINKPLRDDKNRLYLFMKKLSEIFQDHFLRIKSPELLEKFNINL